MAPTKSNELEDYFVGINDPVDVRRKVLETSKESISLLKQYAILRDTKVEKDELIAEYKKAISDINSLMLRLKSELPKIKTSKKAKPIKVTKKLPDKVTKKAIHEVKGKAKKKTELELLEDQLSNVEKQLNSLN